jgi:hypothetical protein
MNVLRRRCLLCAGTKESGRTINATGGRMLRLTDSELDISPPSRLSAGFIKAGHDRGADVGRRRGRGVVGDRRR